MPLTPSLGAVPEMETLPRKHRKKLAKYGKNVPSKKYTNSQTLRIIDGNPANQ